MEAIFIYGKIHTYIERSHYLKSAIQSHQCSLLKGRLWSPSFNKLMKLTFKYLAANKRFRWRSLGPYMMSVSWIELRACQNQGPGRVPEMVKGTKIPYCTTLEVEGQERSRELYFSEAPTDPSVRGQVRTLHRSPSIDWGPS